MPPKRPAEEAAASEVVKKQRLACTFPGCQKDYADRRGLKRHIEQVHAVTSAGSKKSAKRHACTFDGCDKSFSKTGSLNAHIQEKHEGVIQTCTFDGCPKTFRTRRGLAMHIKKIHQNHTTAERNSASFNASSKEAVSLNKPGKQRLACTFPGCDKDFVNLGNLNQHIRNVHQKKRYACTYVGCQKTYSKQGDLNTHILKAHEGVSFPCPICDKTYCESRKLNQHMKAKHGTPDQIADAQQKRLEIRQFLADKQSRGLCNATKFCPHLPVEGSFRCQKHEITVDPVAKALKELERQGKLLPDSIQNPDEFALLQQRPKIFLDQKAKTSLGSLSMRMENVYGSTRTFVMDNEFIMTRAGLHVPLDLTIMRLNGEVIVSTRVDWDMTTKDLRASCKDDDPICQWTISKVYGKSDRTWGKTPEQIINILQNARIFSPDSMI